MLISTPTPPTKHGTYTGSSLHKAEKSFSSFSKKGQSQKKHCSKKEKRKRNKKEKETKRRKERKKERKKEKSINYVKRLPVGALVFVEMC